MTANQRIPFAALLLAALTACGDSDNGLTPADTGGGGTDTGGTDAGGNDAGGNDTGGTDAGEDTAPADTGTDTDPGDTSTDAGGGSTFDDQFYACATDTDCPALDGRERICVNRVCVTPPTRAAILAEEWEEPNPNPDGDDSLTIGYVEERPEEPIDLSCYENGSIYEPVDGPESATLVGQVDRFGSGPATTGLCVSTYDEGLLLPWLVNSECNTLADDQSLELEFVACFQMDPCRCEEFAEDPTDETLSLMAESIELAMEEAGNPFTIDSRDTCFAAIGYCSAIEDAGVREACQTRLRTNTGDNNAASLILGHTLSVENPENEDAGRFEIPNFPVNLRFAYKVSGRENRWRDTWEYGLFSRGDLVEDGNVTINSNAVSAGAWRTIPPAVGFPGGISDRNGAVAGAIRDCGTAERIPWNIVYGTVGIAFLDSSTRLAYFNGNPNNQLPQPGRTDTDPLGLFAAINLPPGPNRVSPVICTANCNPSDPGTTGDPEYTFVGGRNVFQTPKSVIIATFEGLQ